MGSEVSLFRTSCDVNPAQVPFACVHFHCFAYNGLLRHTSGAIPADLLVGNIQ